MSQTSCILLMSTIFIILAFSLHGLIDASVKYTAPVSEGERVLINCTLIGSSFISTSQVNHLRTVGLLSDQMRRYPSLWWCLPPLNKWQYNIKLIWWILSSLMFVSVKCGSDLMYFCTFVDNDFDFQINIHIVVV